MSKMKKRAAERAGDYSKQSVDPFSKLPEPVLDQILCFLSQKEAVRTCVLSKSWRHRGSTRTKLQFRDSVDFAMDAEKMLSVLDSSLQRYTDQNCCLNQLCLAVFGPWVKFDLPTIVSKAEFLQELYLDGFDLSDMNLTDQPLYLRHLRKLSLKRIWIGSEALEMLLSRCPSIQNLVTVEFIGKALDLAHRPEHIEDNGVSSTLETIHLEYHMYWHFHWKYFPRLKSLCLDSMHLSTASFGFFTSDYMPNLEEFELDNCYGFEEFRLSNPSIKRLNMTSLRKLFRATIDAPKLVYFKLSAYDLPLSISLKQVSSEWNSYIDLGFCLCEDNDVSGSFFELNKVLKAVSQSLITLELSHCFKFAPHHPIENHPIENAGCERFYEPVAVENLRLKECYSSSTVSIFFDYLFSVCRPRHICLTQIPDMEFIEILEKVLLHERERRDYSWNRDLMEVVMETSCYNANEWYSVYKDQNICFRLKWREGLL